MIKYYESMTVNNMNNENTSPTINVLDMPPSAATLALQIASDAGLRYGEDVLRLASLYCSFCTYLSERSLPPIRQTITSPFY